MFSQEAAFTITADHISQYAAHLQEQERAKNTVKKYVHDLNDFMLFLNGKAVTKVAVIAWKEHLADTYTPATVNSMLAAVNSFPVHGLAEAVCQAAESTASPFL